MNVLKADVTAITLAVLGEVNERLEKQKRLDIHMDTPLMALGSGLTSLQIVTLTVGVEAAVEERFGVCNVLADDVDVAGRNDAFESVRSLVDYVARVILEQKASMVAFHDPLT